MLRHHEYRVWKVSLSNFRGERVRDRERKERRVREAEMSLIASYMAAGGRAVRKD